MPSEDSIRETQSPSFDQCFVIDSLETLAGSVPVIDSRITRIDNLGKIKIRLGLNRMGYMIDPGLYALGRPDSHSPVLLSANYKLSFDNLRSVLPGRSVWLLVLDTKGINVWCAAGKGTFGTTELVARVASSRLADIVDHRTLIVPQLGAPGVAAHQVQRQSGFRVIYGPVEAKDLPAFIDSGNRATPEMRRKTFTLKERAVLIGVELSIVVKYGIMVGLVMFFLAGLGWAGNLWSNVVFHGTLAVSAFVAAIMAGAVLTPLLLPWLPGRAFSVKGLTAGLCLAALHGAIWLSAAAARTNHLEIGGWMLLGPAFASFLAMNFTGASTFTSLSGVKKEMHFALPLEIGGALIGLTMIIVARFVT
ncbi:MAG: acetyl-CoA synthase subunit gamma [Candidatus Aegiribacteria sp.]|nr:acetyl-CoA synthase subunit gamma [Candidatus Aegiribacteria sp.]